MTPLYSDHARALQDQFDTRRLADRLEQTIVRDHATEEDQAFIGTRDFFLLSTIDAWGWPHCSYKGGAAGFVRFLDPRHLVFPCYDGNGMYLSMGNIGDNAKIAMLFIDFESPKRIRMNGTASIVSNDPLIATFVDAQLVVRVTIERLWPNCPRYIHKYQRLEASPYVPRAGEAAPIPNWKRTEFVKDVLPERDRQRIAQEPSASRASANIEESPRQEPTKR
jgi:predicted pyridoxine 5'-phosphate oxidase superfamily flavin-nucleotide-binding protein